MTWSLPEPSLAPLDPEIEKTLLHIRQARRRLAFVESEAASADSPSYSETNSEMSFNEGTIYSSIGVTDASLTNLGTEHMAAPRRVTLK